MTDASFLRFGVFAGILLILILWELISPRRDLRTAKSGRWITNLGISAIDTITLRLIFGAGAYGLAVVGSEKGWGLFHHIQMPTWTVVVLSVLLLDFVIYLQHVVFHAIPLFWRIHRVHHTDLDLDVTSGIRFHPIEIVLSMCIKAALVLALGIPALAVLIFEVILNAASMFNHGNIGIPLGVDRIVRLFVITPDMHRVHHSVIIKETNSNFGFSHPWWDRLLGTYRASPEKGHLDMVLGLANYRDEKKLGLPSLLMIPFRK